MDDNFKDKSSLPFVSFIIPTYNAEKNLEICLNSVFIQEYPKEKYEVLIIDGKSSDMTLEIAKRYQVKILFNPLRMEDGPYGGKAIGVKNSQGQFLCFLDSDNVLSSYNWLKMMIQPFIDNPDIAACETSRFNRKKDSSINRFCSSLVLQTPNMDPFIPFHKINDKKLIKITKNYIIYTTRTNPPSIANGTIIKKETINRLGGFDYDIDLALRMTKKGYVKFVKVLDVGIYHYYVPNINIFIKKAIRHAQRFLFFMSNRTIAIQHYLPYEKNEKSAILRSVLEGITVIGPLAFAIKKIKRHRDNAWLYYPILNFLTILIYAIILVTNPNDMMKLSKRGEKR